MQDIETNQITGFWFERCFSIKEWRIQNFIRSSKLFDLVWLSFFHKPIFGFNDDAHKNEIYSIQNNQVVLWLFYIWGLIEKYMVDPLIQEPYNILRNSDKIPHIIIKS